MSRLFAVAACSCLVLLAAGCGDALNPNAKARPVANPPGVAPPGMMDPLAGNQAPANPQAAPPQGAPQQPVPPRPANADGKGIIGKMTDEVIDYNTAIAANPNLVIIDNKTKGDDPLSFAASAYINARSQASMLGFQAWLKQHKIVEERNPTYAEFVQAMKDNNVKFTMRPEWQKYAYDAKEGALFVVEDAALKAARYKEAGIDPNTK